MGEENEIKIIRIEVIMENKNTGERSLYSIEGEDADKLLLIIKSIKNLYDQSEKFKIKF